MTAFDLSKLLQDWEFDPEEIRVRIIKGSDGRDRVQMRVELGVLQMEMDGRPDGARPENFESWLDYYEEMKRIHESVHAESEAYVLREEDLGRLWREAMQYYHRYLSFWHLNKYDLCARDTARNLRLFSFVRAHTTHDRHKLQFDQWRPYVTMMYARAVATPLIKEEKFDEALRHVEAGIDAIRDFLDEYGQTHRSEQCAELVDLEKWREQLLVQQARAASHRGEDPVDDLRRKLNDAVAREAFEEAARLRDELRRLGNKGPATA